MKENSGCPHQQSLCFEDIYNIPHDGICDHCGTPLGCICTAGIYLGDTEVMRNLAHIFSVAFSCLGCHGTIITILSICGGIDVSEGHLLQAGGL